MPLIHPEHDPNLYCPPVIQVPDGLTADEARQILADAVRWVPLPGGPTEMHVGCRVRQVECGVVTTAMVGCRKANAIYADPDGEEKFVGFRTSGDWFIHPADVPDIDADLIERMAEALYSFDSVARDLPWSETAQDGTFRKEYRQAARAALAVVREADAR